MLFISFLLNKFCLLSFIPHVLWISTLLPILPFFTSLRFHVFHNIVNTYHKLIYSYFFFNQCFQNYDLPFHLALYSLIMVSFLSCMQPFFTGLVLDFNWRLCGIPFGSPEHSGEIPPALPFQIWRPLDYLRCN